ncbi:hypothetical protein GRI40_05620 [Altererythrobacter aerius]|uniref:Uncharacterized protein n=1 Tax=Tsuneonella aeria TaxID=1837929 RepID=A0A6I4TB18_9SPHN|nr:hypothetical protein [Tsuneonella aeria]MXO74699.1 hypothetical protein [Tsuneonella aeria]
MSRNSPQVILAAAASVLALSALAIAAPTIADRADGSASLAPLTAGLPTADLPALPLLLPR